MMRKLLILSVLIVDRGRGSTGMLSDAATWSCWRLVGGNHVARSRLQRCDHADGR